MSFLYILTPINHLQTCCFIHYLTASRHIILHTFPLLSIFKMANTLLLLKRFLLFRSVIYTSNSNVFPLLFSSSSLYSLLVLPPLLNLILLIPYLWPVHSILPNLLSSFIFQTLPFLFPLSNWHFSKILFFLSSSLPAI